MASPFSLERRRFLTGRFASSVRAKVVHKARGSIFPPGTENFERLFSSCDACGGCVEGCPKHLIHLEGDPPLPVLRFDRSGCLFCEGYPCAAACDRNALTLPTVKLPIGTAVFHSSYCASETGSECRMCASACPQKAIDLIDGRPHINESCDGCGFCIPACSTVSKPAAISIEPRRET
ncbi:MAG TPA: hypothetical protein VI895_01315 [Bdellovibrionota bacterium]|nr:hypothetical protein [Bdellovibrionota bacterium]